MNHTIVIAEAGVNHNGNLENALKLIDVAKDSGADYVKFQTFKSERLVNKDAKKVNYQKANLRDADDSQYNMLKKLELTDSMHQILIDYCIEKDIKFLSTPFDTDSIDLLKNLGILIGKIPSGEITNLPYLKKMATTFPYLILSTGMSTMDEVEEAISILLKSGAKKENLTILHCTTEYPTPMKDVNLTAMLKLGEKFQVKFGYSDHSQGIEVSIAAVALGASVIEKHFTLDKNMEGPDHKASLEPVELKEMVKCIRNIELALGDGIKVPSDSEKKNFLHIRKSIVAARNILEGEIFTEENLTTKRPGFGISPMKLDNVIGKRAKKDFSTDEIISL